MSHFLQASNVLSDSVHEPNETKSFLPPDRHRCGEDILTIPGGGPSPQNPQSEAGLSSSLQLPARGGLLTWELSAASSSLLALACWKSVCTDSWKSGKPSCGADHRASSVFGLRYHIKQRQHFIFSSGRLRPRSVSVSGHRALCSAANRNEEDGKCSRHRHQQLWDHGDDNQHLSQHPTPHLLTLDTSECPNFS